MTLIEKLSRGFMREQIQKPTTADIEMAAAIESAINAFYITITIYRTGLIPIIGEEFKSNLRNPAT